jgi:O-antigen ligase
MQALAPLAAPSVSRIIVGLARSALLVLLAVVYSGFFIQRAGSMAYLAMMGLMFIIVILDPERRLDARPVIPYLAWIAFFGLWGLLVSPAPAQVRTDALRLIFHNFLIVGALVVALRHRGDFIHLARLVQIVVIASFLIAVRGLTDPGFIVALTGEPSIDPNRAAALWVDPNFASVAFLLGLLICGTDRGLLAWVARAAAIGGIILTFSRMGLILLVVVAVIFLVHRLRQMRFGFGHAVTMMYLIALLAVAALGGYMVVGPPDVHVELADTDVPLNERIFDLTEEQTRETGGRTRGELALEAAQAALAGPWHGSGIFEYQDPRRFPTTSPLRESRVGAHNLYVVAWGETGILGLFLFLSVLVLGISKMLLLNMSTTDRFIGLMMWLGYLLTGLVLHHQFDSPVSIFHAGLLFLFPHLVAQSRSSQPVHSETADSAAVQARVW